MDQKMLRLLAAGGVTVAIGVGLYAYMHRDKKSGETAKAQEHRPQKPKRVNVQVSGLTMPLRSFDREILKLIDAPPPTTKMAISDVLPQSPHEVTLFTDPGHRRVRSVRIDLYRDRQDDEKWMIAENPQGGREITREVDIGRHRGSERYHLVNDQWALVSGVGSTLLVGYGPDVKPPPETEALRPMDKEILDVAAKAGKERIERDALPSAPFKVSLFRRNGKTERARVDVNRDKKSVENWILKDDVVRMITDDHGNVAKQFVLKDGQWVRRY